MLRRLMSPASGACTLRCILLLGASALPLAAATTSPVGYTEQRIAGTGGQLDRAQTYLATPMLGREAETGVIARIDGTTVHLQSSTRSGKDDPASASTRSSYAGTHYLQIAKGPRAGYHADLAGGAAESLQTTRDLSSLLQPGDPYEVRPYTTLTRILGSNNQSAGLHAAAGFDQADQIYIPDPQSGQLAAYYYRQQGDAAPVLAHRDGRPVETDPILYPGSGFMISRIGEEDVSIVSTGDVQNHAAVIPVETGINFIASTFPVDTTLAGFIGSLADELTEEDFLAIPRDDGLQDQYRLLRTADGSTRWLPNAEAPPADQATIPAGAVLILYRQGPPFNLHLKRPFQP